MDILQRSFLTSRILVNPRGFHRKIPCWQSETKGKATVKSLAHGPQYWGPKDYNVWQKWPDAFKQNLPKDVVDQSLIWSSWLRLLFCCCFHSSVDIAIHFISSISKAIFKSWDNYEKLLKRPTVYKPFIMFAIWQEKDCNNYHVFLIDNSCTFVHQNHLQFCK